MSKSSLNNINYPVQKDRVDNSKVIKLSLNYLFPLLCGYSLL